MKSLIGISGTTGTKNVEIIHQALANKLGTTRVVVSRVLKKLENEGELELDRGLISLK